MKSKSKKQKISSITNENNSNSNNNRTDLGLTVTLELDSPDPICPKNGSQPQPQTQKPQPVISPPRFQIPHPFPANCLLMMDQENTNNSSDHPIIKLARHVFLQQANNKNSNSNHKKNDNHYKNNLKWTPTPIQLQSWPILTASSSKASGRPTARNLIAIAPTGSGKTFSYSIPMVQSCMERIQSIGTRTTGKNNITLSFSRVHGLVLVPTRELSIQVSKVLQCTAKCANQLLKRPHAISAMAIYGGVKKDIQVKELLLEKRGEGEEEHSNANHGSSFSFLLISATPMRLIDLLGLHMDHIGDCANDGDDNVDRSDDHDQQQQEQQHHLIRGLFSTTQFLVMDEADRLATHNDISRQVETIVQFLKQKSSCLNHQCLFSATLPERAMPVCHSWISPPRVSIRVNAVTIGGCSFNVSDQQGQQQQQQQQLDAEQDSKELLHSTEETMDLNTKPTPAKGKGRIDLSDVPSHITQILHVCSNHKKPRKLLHTIETIRKQEQGSTTKGADGRSSRRRNKGLMIVFFGRIKTLQYIEKLLSNKEGIDCLPFHSQMNQQKREQHLHLFKSGKVPILLATDIAARGIHCNNVEYIINYDFPSSLEQYVHRCGRAGRNKVHSDGVDTDSGANVASASSTVYGFFHRELAPMAKDVVDLLVKCNAWVDPNLLELVPAPERSVDDVDQPKRKRRKRNDSQAPEMPHDKANHVDQRDIDDANMKDDDEEEEDDNEFASLGQKRIIFERASHVRDDSSDEDDDENTD